MTRRTVGRGSRAAAHRRFSPFLTRSAGERAVGAYSRPATAGAVTLDMASIPGLMQLGSAALPIGAFSHSLGMEAAVEAGVVADADSAARWIGDYLELVWARGDAPLWLQLHAAWERADADELARLNERVLAVRESRELLLECTQTGHSLRLWLLALPDLPGLRIDQRAELAALQPLGYLTAHALAARALGLSAATGLHACAWGLLENLTTAAVKLVPLGQTQGQAILRRLALRLPAAIATAQVAAEATVANFAPMLAIRSAQHETQYSRLFRS